MKSLKAWFASLFVATLPFCAHPVLADQSWVCHTQASTNNDSNFVLHLKLLTGSLEASFQSPVIAKGEIFKVAESRQNQSGFTPDTENTGVVITFETGKYMDIEQWDFEFKIFTKDAQNSNAQDLKTISAMMNYAHWTEENGNQSGAYLLKCVKP